MKINGYKYFQYNIEIMIFSYLYSASNFQNDNIQFFSWLEMKANKKNWWVIYWGKFELPLQHFFIFPLPVWLFYCLTFFHLFFLSLSLVCEPTFNFNPGFCKDILLMFLNMLWASCYYNNFKMDEYSSSWRAKNKNWNYLQYFWFKCFNSNSDENFVESLLIMLLDKNP